MSETHNKNEARSVGIILDGNRRWARSVGLPQLEGHRRGYNKMKEICDWAEERGVMNLFFYAFSTENWKRTEEEVSYLMDLFRVLLKKDVPEFHKRGKRLRFMGDLSILSPDLREGMKEAEAETDQNTKGTVCICVSYGGRGEIVNAVKKIVAEGKLKPEEITEETFSKYLYAPEVPDPDLIIRTGGEMRLSNFLTWESTYSEFFFPKTFLPAFTKEEFFAILDEFSNRKRNLGK